MRTRETKAKTKATFFAKMVFAATMSISASTAMADPSKAPLPDGKESPKSDQAVIKETTTVLGLPQTNPLPPVNIVGDELSHDPSPEEITKIKMIWDRMRRSQETQVGSQPRPSISIANLDLSPGSTPPVVRLSVRTGAIIDFIDASGNPWPVDHVSNLSANEIDVAVEEQSSGDKPTATKDTKDSKTAEPEKKYDTNAISAKARHFASIGNAAVFLKTMPTPVIITFLSGQKDVDYRVDFRVPAHFNKSSGEQFDKSYFDNRLSSATMGITPEGCQRLITDSGQVMAWSCENKEMIVRVSGILMSPAPIDGAKVDSVDGTKAYIVPESPIVTVAVDDKISFVKVELKE